MGKNIAFRALHTVNHSGRNPKTEGRAAKNIDVKARATFCLTCNMIKHLLKSAILRLQKKNGVDYLFTNDVVWRDLATQKGTPVMLSRSSKMSATAIAVALAR